MNFRNNGFITIVTPQKIVPHRQCTENNSSRQIETHIVPQTVVVLLSFIPSFVPHTEIVLTYSNSDFHSAHLKYVSSPPPPKVSVLLLVSHAIIIPTIVH